MHGVLEKRKKLFCADEERGSGVNRDVDYSRRHLTKMFKWYGLFVHKGCCDVMLSCGCRTVKSHRFGGRGSKREARTGSF